MGGSCDDFIDEGKISLRSCESVRTSVSTGFLQAQWVSYRTLACQRLDLRLIQRPSHHLCSTKWFACSAIRVQYLLGRLRRLFVLNSQCASCNTASCRATADYVSGWWLWTKEIQHAAQLLEKRPAPSVGVSQTSVHGAGLSKAGPATHPAPQR